MAGKASLSRSFDEFEFMLFEGDPDHLKSVICNPSQTTPWIDPNALKLSHRMGRGSFGDVWLATHHHCSEDYAWHHEVAVKMLYSLKDDQLQAFLAKFEEIFSKFRGLESICFLHGVSIHNGRACIVMKFYRGSIGDKMARLDGGKLSLSDVLRYGADLARGIMELHSRGILVLNLKPYYLGSFCCQIRIWFRGLRCQTTRLLNNGSLISGVQSKRSLIVENVLWGCFSMTSEIVL